MRYLLLIMLVVSSCKTTSKSSVVDQSIESQGVFAEIAREITEDYILIKVENVSGSDQIIMNPMKKSIERQIDGAWKPVGVLYCDCGGPPCPAPPRERPVGSNGTFNFKWDLMVEECRSDENGRSTVKEKASSGLYRVTYAFKAEAGDTQQLVLTFSL